MPDTVAVLASLLSALWLLWECRAAIRACRKAANACAGSWVADVVADVEAEDVDEVPELLLVSESRLLPSPMAASALMMASSMPPPEGVAEVWLEVLLEQLALLWLVLVSWETQLVLLTLLIDMLFSLERIEFSIRFPLIESVSL